MAPASLPPQPPRQAAPSAPRASQPTQPLSEGKPSDGSERSTTTAEAKAPPNPSRSRVVTVGGLSWVV
ncbi:unnamed protein product [Polarella glacialis]|uniref:Uncharacterized protein n=2 Tax=Polarella glacialis TaxID=89957 RepID=A0A813G4Q3_POLGL|nr:unnamed protein product [Polarella glacialis]CAE8743029.1 unnamed protein product [Polarella glacialis]